MSTKKMVELETKSPIACWRLHPDYEAEILRRMEQAQSEGREYVIDGDEARSIARAVGQKTPSIGFMIEANAISKLSEMKGKELEKEIKGLEGVN